MRRIPVEQSRVITVSMPPELIERIDRASERTGLSKSKIIQQGTDKRLREIEAQ